MRCLSPVVVEDEMHKGHFIEVPCGRCIACRVNRTREWSLRLMFERDYWSDAQFVTLTFDDDHYPFDGSIRTRDLQLFFKRLRKGLQGQKIIYYACGEYGSQSQRAHYHAIVFGLSFLDYQTVKDAWPYGIVWLEGVTYQSCAYVAGYVQKKLYGQAEGEYGLRKPPFSVSSRGIGERYAIEHKDKILAMEPILVNGKAVPTPRYFIKKALEFSSVNERDLWMKSGAFRKLRSDSANAYYDELMERIRLNYGCTPDEVVRVLRESQEAMQLNYVKQRENYASRRNKV